MSGLKSVISFPPRLELTRNTLTIVARASNISLAAPIPFAPTSSTLDVAYRGFMVEKQGQSHVELVEAPAIKGLGSSSHEHIHLLEARGKSGFLDGVDHLMKESDSLMKHGSGEKSASLSQAVEASSPERRLSGYKRKVAESDRVASQSECPLLVKVP